MSGSRFITFEKYDGAVANLARLTLNITLVRSAVLRYMNVYQNGTPVALQIYKTTTITNANWMYGFVVNDSLHTPNVVYGAGLYLVGGEYCISVYNASGGARTIKLVASFEYVEFDETDIVPVRGMQPYRGL